MKFLSLTTISILLLTVSSQAVTPFAEYFTATSLNTSRWTLDQERGNLTQSSGRLYFSTPFATGETYSGVTLRNIQPSYNENWEVLITVVNNADNKWGTYMGIAVQNAADMDDFAGLEIHRNGLEKYVSGLYGTNGVENGLPKSTTASKLYFRIRFNKDDKVLTHWYRSSTTAAWTKHYTFSTKGSTLTTRRGNWGMTNTSKFVIALYGEGDNSAVTSGQMYVDNFKIRNY